MTHWRNTIIGLVLMYTPEWYSQFGGMCNVCHKRPIYALITCGHEECRMK